MFSCLHIDGWCWPGFINQIFPGWRAASNKLQHSPADRLWLGQNIYHPGFTFKLELTCLSSQSLHTTRRRRRRTGWCSGKLNISKLRREREMSGEFVTRALSAVWPGLALVMKEKRGLADKYKSDKDWSSHSSQLTPTVEWHQHTEKILTLEGQLFEMFNLCEYFLCCFVQKYDVLWRK